MAMPRQMMIYSFLFGGLLLLGSVPRLVGPLSERDDIWWTPKAMAVPVGEAKDRVEIYVGDTPLPHLLEAGRMRVDTGAGTRVLTSGDVRIRFNNWDRRRAQRSSVHLAYAAAAGAGFFLLASGLIGLFDRSRQRV